MKKSLSAINTVSAQELSSTTNLWMCEYKESTHPTHLWIKPNTPAYGMMGKQRTYVNWMVLAIIFLFKKSTY